MAHTLNPTDKLLNRVRRIRGQVEAIERALMENQSCGDLLCLIASSRGAMNSLMAEIIDEHVRTNLLHAPGDRERAQAADELLDVIDSYLR
jgi:DNA-binding FrmR family transcriptional regulator